MTLAVSEIFSSLQGEGPYAGQPSVFVRLAGCVPPFCAWCDTPHALHTEGSSVRHMTPQEIATEVALHPHALVVITGGEPFRQWETGLRRLVTLLIEATRRIQYETSGKAGIPSDHHGMVVCSPKPVENPQLAPECVARVDAFKFVVDQDVTPVLACIRAHAIDPARVWLMPLGATRTEQMQRMAGIWEMCVRHGFNFSPRLHILTFDDKKGV